ncbi:hypothetical protein AB0F92_17745 [Kitasatospora aureofaciens]|uniref:Uncharacterized protein n=1 Tax=Kitasatospora aureofaciens TaxID=1894 RepID=A0A1E7NF62_KITAU|nr:hypothetical protein [Kitasatospora aureofaciens]OEV39312.1 hypothetical protein HS99_0000940 [Kitasatospora aureofaciens]GGU88007.1 hypothetical protein GCM10010502_45740 [Kitasatospora aureofaciens]
MTTTPAPGAAAPARPADPNVFERLRPVADAVLYEGYLLYPYRRSSAKNRVRWQFGVLAPRPWVEAGGPVAETVAGSAESWYQQTECLAEAAPGAVLHVRVRYLQVQHKSVQRRTADGRYEPVESLQAPDAVHLSFEEAVPRETDLVLPLAELLAGDRTFEVGAPGGEQTEELPDADGRAVRRCHPVEARTTVHAEPLDGRLYRLRVRTENTGRQVGPGATREEALRHTLVATHTFLGGSGLSFLSLTDPPERAAEHARACRNLHTYPVPADADRAVLSSPIILPDQPRIAPESPGDLHDAGEIDEILSLRTMLLTDEEKREARATDRRAAEILDRVDTMPPEVFTRLHGAIRSLRPAGRPEPGARPEPAARAPWWEEGGDDGLAPATDRVLVDGVSLARGSRVELRPHGRGSDAQDMFLAGRTAEVAAVFHDVDGSVHLAVTVDDDPGAELHGWYGRYRYFRPDEVRPLGTTPDETRSDGHHRTPGT